MARPIARVTGAALSAIALACAAGCGLCANTDFKDYVSPDGRMKVVVFTRDCGATTDFSTQASIVSTSAAPTPTGPGNAFVADSSHSETPDAPGPALRVRWLDGHTVELSHDTNVRIFKAETAVDYVRIIYKRW